MKRLGYRHSLCDVMAIVSTSNFSVIFGCAVYFRCCCCCWMCQCVYFEMPNCRSCMKNMRKEQQIFAASILLIGFLSKSINPFVVPCCWSAASYPTKIASISHKTRFQCAFPNVAYHLIVVGRHLLKMSAVFAISNQNKGNAVPQKCRIFKRTSILSCVWTCEKCSCGF